MGCFRVILGLIFVVIAVPALIAFESLAALRSAALDRDRWYELVEEQAFYESFVASVREGLPMSATQRELAIGAITPEYVAVQLHTLVDYGFDLLEGRNPPEPTFQMPAPLASVLRENPQFNSIGWVEQSDGSLSFTPNISASERAQVIGAGRNLTNVFVIAGAIGLGAWFVSGMIAFDTTQGRLLWLGLWLMVASGLVVVIGLAFNSTIVPAMTESVLADAESSDGVTRGVAQGLLGIIGGFGTAFLLAGGIPALIGLLMLLVGSTLRPPAPTIGGGLSGRSGVISAE
ncbi:MAG: hypothetical protein MUF38_13955 [Anaerolineae bacterium]|nr:hypothetical protein [Anaerolineae bacterium]